MADNADEELDSTNQPTEEVEKTEEVDETSVELETEDLEVLQEKNKKLFERAKKAEAETKILKAERLKKEEQAKVEPPEKQGGLTVKDGIALNNAKVTEEEDIDDVVEYATFKKLSIGEALKTTVIKTMLAEKDEQRKTAEATATGAGRRGTSKPTDDALLANADKGKFPDDAEDLAEAYHAQKLKK